MRWTALHQGYYEIDALKNFNRVDQMTAQQKDGKVYVAVRCFLIEIDHEYILLDTGLQLEEQDEFHLFKLLENLHIKPNQIHRIILSHLHKDHSGGLGSMRDGYYTSNFPNAQIYIQEKELIQALKNERPASYNNALLSNFDELENVVYLKDESGFITPHIRYDRTGGHTLNHQTITIREEEEIVFYGADNLPKKEYLKYHLAYKTDEEGRKAKDLRILWEKTAKAEKWNILLYHDLDCDSIQIP